MAARPTSRSLGRAVVALGALLVVAVAAVVVVVVLQVRGGDDSDASGGDGGGGGEAAAPARPVTLDDVAAAGPLLVARAWFCDEVDPTAVEAALAGPVADRSAYDNGDTAALTDAVADVAHEHGCTWSTAQGAVARAWVFAPPVTPGRARRLAGLLSGAAGCAPYDATAFGDPTTAFTCTTETGTTATHAGLFGDAWLSCSVTVPAGGVAVDPVVLQQRADAWCAAVATGAGDPA